MPTSFFKDSFGFFSEHWKFKTKKKQESKLLSCSQHQLFHLTVPKITLCFLDSLSYCQLRPCLPFVCVSAFLLLFFTHTKVHTHTCTGVHTKSPTEQELPRESLNAPAYASVLGSAFPTTPGSSKIPVSE